LIKDIFSKLSKLLLSLHQKGISHRDLKSDNVIVKTDKQTSQVVDVRLIDFGFSFYIQSNEKFNKVCGTPNYMSPEIFNQEKICTQKTDIWSLGIILYKLVTNRYPFKHSRENEKLKTNFDMNIFNGIEDSLKDLLVKILNTNP
jgi:serine/threonine protein kinase